MALQNVAPLEKRYLMQSSQIYLHNATRGTMVVIPVVFSFLSNYYFEARNTFFLLKYFHIFISIQAYIISKDKAKN